ncbi:MAG: nucleoside deaminase [Bacteroidales bacterium]
MNTEQELHSMLTTCIRMACDNVINGTGGPFAALLIRDGQVIGKGTNRVISSHDATAHAEVVAIRDACKNTGSHDLTGAVLITSCEPCPMCLGAVYWAGIKEVYFVADREDAAAAGFNDALIYNEIAKPFDQRIVLFRKINHPGKTEPFRIWESTADKTEY